jgi:osmoprotectant transport system permease protein
MKRIVRLYLPFVLVLLFTGCTDEKPVKIASLDFTEQKLLAEMMALLAEQQGMRVERAFSYGDNRRTLEAIQRGVVDAYPAYNGTLLALSGQPAEHEAQKAREEVRRLVEPLGLRWLEPFGLENGFALAVRRDVAIRRQLEQISDLTQLPGKLRIAVDDGYLSRPVDGLYALARRYGLKFSEIESFPVDDRKLIYRALREHRVDVAEVFNTDARLNEYGIVALRDDLHFYPVYEAAPLVRSTTLDAYPELAEAWARLAGRIDTDIMSRLNGRVERGGEDYRDVARSYLETLELLPKRPSAEEPKGSITLAVSPLSDLGYLPIRAAAAIREVMPARRLLVDHALTPADAVREGDARFGLVGAEEFFSVGKTGAPTRLDDLEAVGVVGWRFAHVLVGDDAQEPSHWRQIGVGPEGGSSWTVARLVLEAMGMQDRVELIASEGLLDAKRLLDSGVVDALVLMLEQGHAGLMKLLDDGGAKLVNVRAFRGGSPALRYPFLRPAKIPADTYPGQAQPIDTVTGQVVLATRVPVKQDPIGESGPGFVPGVFTRLPQRLPFDTALRLSDVLGVPERVDPVLPASPGLRPETPSVRPRVYAEPASAVLNVLAILFLVAMVVLLFRELPTNPALKGDEKRAERD